MSNKIMFGPDIRSKDKFLDWHCKEIHAILQQMKHQAAEVNIPEKESRYLIQNEHKMIKPVPTPLINQPAVSSNTACKRCKYNLKRLVKKGKERFQTSSCVMSAMDAQKCDVGMKSLMRSVSAFFKTQLMEFR